MKKRLLLFCALSSAILANAQTFHGRILAEDQPAAFATVFIENAGKGTRADSAGNFNLPGVAKGRYILRISYVGYDPFSQQIEFDGSPDLRVFTLQPSANSLDAIVITGSMKAMRKADSPVPVEIYAPKFFLQNPTPSLFDAVQMINGVRPQLQCNVCNTGDIHINGMEGPYTMVLIDGMPIVSGLSTVYGLSGIPNSVLQRLEVVKGPAASLYGSEAMGGLINVITKDPPEKAQLQFDVNGSSYGEFNTDVAASRAFGRARMLLSGNYFHYNTPFDRNGDNFTDLTLQKRLSLFNKWRFERRDNRIANLAFRYLWENRYGGELQWTPRWRGTDSIYGESIRTQRYEVLGNYQLPIRGEKILLAFSFNRHHQDSYYGDVPYLADQRIGFSQLTWERSAGRRHDLLFGAGFRHTFYDDNTPVTADPGGATNAPQKVTLPGFFVQDQWNLGAHWKLLSGLRFDYDRRHGPIWSPRFNLKYNPDTDNTLRFSAGSGFRVANVFSEDHAALTGGRTVVFTEALDPERTWNFNVNYTRFQEAGFGFINLDATAFYTYFFNKISADYDTDPDKIIYANLDGFAENFGFSLNSDWNFTNGLKANAGFTLLEVRNTEKGVREWQIQTPRFTGNWQLSFPLPRRNLTLDYNGYVYSPMRLPVFPDDYRPATSPWFSIHNLQITWKSKKSLEIYGGIKNIFNFYPREDVIMRPFDPFDKRINDPVDNPNGYTFDPSYNYAPLQGARGFVGLRATIQ